MVFVTHAQRTKKNTLWSIVVCVDAGRIHSMKTDNSSIEKVEEFQYLGTTITNQNSIQEEIKSRLKLGNACYYSMHNHPGCYPKI